MSVVARLFAGCLILVVVAIFVAGVAVYAVFRFSDAEPVRGAWSQPLDGARALTTHIDLDNGDVTVADALPAAPVVGDGTAIETEYVAGSSTPVDRNWQVVDGTGIARLGFAPADPPAAVLRWLRSPEQATWDIGLNPTVPVDLGVDIAHGSARLDLTGLEVSRLDLNIAIGDADIVLGDAAAATGPSRIRVGVGNVRLDVPEAVPVRLRISALGDVDAGDAFLYDGMTYTNRAWQNRTDLTSGLDLAIDTGTGYVTLSSLTSVTDQPVSDVPETPGTPAMATPPTAPRPVPTAPIPPIAPDQRVPTVPMGSIRDVDSGRADQRP